MASTLYLTPAEQLVLHSDLASAYTVEPETSDAYESEDVLQVRMNIARFGKFPPVQKMIDALKAGRAPTAADLSAVPDDMLPTFFFTLGARGVTALIAALLKEIRGEDDMRTLQILSEIRHDILKTNASVHTL